MERERGDGRAGFALAILFAINLLNFFDRNLFGALAEPIKREWSLSDARIGFLAFAFTVLYAVVGVPLGRLSDRRGAAADFGCWRGGVEFVDGGFWVGLELRIAICGAAGRGNWRGELRACGERHDRGLLPGEEAGSGAGNFYAGFAIREFSFFVFWRALGGGLRLAEGLFHCVCAGFASGCLALLVKDPPRGAAEISRHASRAHEGSAYWSVLKIPTMRWLIISGALHNFMMYTIAVFVPGLLARYHGLNLKDANSVNSIVFGLVGFRDC